MSKGRSATRKKKGGRPKQGAEKRSGRRAVINLEILIEGRSGSFAGQTVDLSRTGALLWITDERFVTGSDANDMVRFSERVAQEFGEGLRIVFGAVGAQAADVVRVTRKGRDDASPMLVACRFPEPLDDQTWQALGGSEVAAQASAPRPPPRPTQRAAVGPPSGVDERRAAKRVDRVLYVEVQGDYGTYTAYALNVSTTGVLLTITDPQFAAPAEPDQLVMFTKRMGFQFRNGMFVRFLEAEVTVEADVVRVAEHPEGAEILIVIGVKFRRALTNEECARLELEPPPESAAPKAQFESAAALPAAPAARGERTRIHALMVQAANLHASDLHIKVNSPPRMRISGELIDVHDNIISQDEAHAMALDLMSPGQARRFENEGDMEFAYGIKGSSRFRVAAFKQRGSSGLAIRCIPTHIPTFEELGLPDIARYLADRPRGLVLVTGPTGSGKSHTLAAMVNHINQTRSCHILTMEDPIEFYHADIRSHITQREIGRDCNDFAGALTRALRQDPDVILVGEMRDLETISLALTAAETGHLVFATLHTTSAAQSPDRIIDVFPSSQQTQIRQQLSASLQGVLAQILVPRIEGGVVMAQEILVATEGVRNLIREMKTPQLLNMLQTGGKDGMQTLEWSLNQLVAQGIVTYDIAVGKANFPKQIELVDSRGRRIPPPTE